jgi:outer membrane immunogenic protein
MKRLILGVAAALLLSAGPAAADGLPSKGVVKALPEAGPNWNGFYVGVGIGAGAVVHDYNETVNCCEYSTNSVDLGGDGIFGTVTIGYDRVLRPGWVGGVFADYDFGSNISTNVSGNSIDQNHSWSIGGRLGFLTTPSTLIYGTGGYTQSEFDVVDSSKTFNGYFVGAGVETFLRDNWTLKLEYRFSKFDEKTVYEDYCVKDTDEPSEHSARLVLSYKFGQHD